MKRFTAMVLLSVLSSTAIATESSRLAHEVETQVSHTPVVQTSDVKTLAAYWSLDVKEYQRYQELMRGPLGTWNPAIDPLLALGRELFRGTIDGCSVYPREVVKATLEVNAAAVIFAHNHPSGVAEPSRSDRQITDRLKEALGLIDVRVLDHFVVGDKEVISFAERGWI